MKPDFALSLSFDGITLLHRAAGGWRRVGEVALDAPDLRAELADLRDRAARMSPSGLACKIILPNEQIRYMSVETGSFDGDTRREIVRQALESATPYALEELVYDMSVDGGTSHVAAIAIETLEEAQSFAAEHAFNPVSFVAIPSPDAGFLGEPWFGPSGEVGDGVEIEPDGVVVVVIGDVELPDAETAHFEPALEPAFEPEPVVEDPEPDTAFRRRDDGGANVSTEGRRVPAERSRITLIPEPDPQLEADVAALEAQQDDVDDTEERFAQALVTAPVLDIPEAPEETPESAGFASFFTRRVRAGGAGAPAPNRAMRAARQVAAQSAGTVDFELPERQKPQDEASRMTVFGARVSDEVGGKQKHLGLILTAALLLFLAAIAAWASLFLDDGIAGLFKSRDDAPRIVEEDRPAPVAPARPAPRAPQVLADDPGAPQAPNSDFGTEPTRQSVADAPAQNTQQAPQQLSETDIAVLEALNEASTTPAPEQEPAPEVAAAPLDDAARYAATGIWPTAPLPPETPAIIGLDDLVSTSIDRTDLSQDAVALPDVAALDLDALPSLPSLPSAAGTQFALDDQGLVAPSADGTLNPDGILVFAGLPSVRPPRFPDRGARQAEEDAAAAEEVRTRLAALRPRVRPDNMAERVERSQFGGLTRSELADARPRARPVSLQEEAEQIAADEASGDDTETASAQAVQSSRRPDVRPSDFSEQVARAVAAAAAATAPENAPSGTDGAETVAAAVAPAASVQPRIPSSASVARQATLNNAINLRRVNLIGVFGTPSDRRALVRLPSGRYKKVKVGDRVDGGQIVAIGDSELRYQKGGRNLTLKIPSG
ncbi:MAG: hypothetical protein AB3N11_11010 [Arenibacterium sp.]